MARTNKYATVNFNEIFEKKKTKKPSSSSSSSTTNPTNNNTTHQKTYLSTTRTHGGMLVLNRPSPKPQPQPQPQPSIPPPPPPQSPKPLDPGPDQTRSEPVSVSISLRPLGRTGSSISSSSLSLTTTTTTTPQDREPLPLSKPEPFVPPHLRPGFVGREERFGQDGQKNQGFRSRDFGQGQGQVGSPNRISEDRRPKSGGGYERMQRGGDSDLGEMNRPNSSGNRPNSGGWYGSSSSYRSPPHY